MVRTGKGPVSVSFLQKRICSCMVDPKMNQCADPIDTQHNVLFDVWRRNVPQWLDETTCGRSGCICKEQGFRDMKSQDDLFTFLFCGECAAVADPTRKLPRDDSAPMQLRYDCVAGECEKDGCLQDKCTRLANCPVLTKAMPRLPPPCSHRKVYQVCTPLSQSPAQAF